MKLNLSMSRSGNWQMSGFTNKDMPKIVAACNAHEELVLSLRKAEACLIAMSEVTDTPLMKEIRQTLSHAEREG